MEADDNDDKKLASYFKSHAERVPDSPPWEKQKLLAAIAESEAEEKKNSFSWRRLALALPVLASTLLVFMLITKRPTDKAAAAPEMSQAEFQEAYDDLFASDAGLGDGEGFGF